MLRHVLQQRCGIPITISIVYGAIARRLGLVADLLPVPGHIMLRVREVRSGGSEGGKGGGEVGPHDSVSGDLGARIAYVDPFRRGRRLAPEEIRQFVSENFGDHVLVRSSRDLLEPMEASHVFARMVANMENSMRMSGRETLVQSGLRFKLLRSIVGRLGGSAGQNGGLS